MDWGGSGHTLFASLLAPGARCPAPAHLANVAKPHRPVWLRHTGKVCGRRAHKRPGVKLGPLDL